MRIETSSTAPIEYRTPALVIGCFEDASDELFEKCDQALDGLLSRMAQTKEFSGKKDSTRLIHTLGRLPAERLLMVGLGKKVDLDDERLRQGSGNAVQVLKAARLPCFASALQSCGAETAASAVCEGALLSAYSFDDYKTKDRDDRFQFELMTLLVPETGGPLAAGERVEWARAVCQGVVTARNLVSHPGNVVTPARLAALAQELASRCGLACRVLEGEDLEKLGMGALLSVGKGSAEPPRLIVLEYQGAESETPTVLVGKGITFDSGGISLKPGAGMEKMKTDMAGAAAVLGTLEAASLLKLPVRLVGVIPTAENMPGSRAYKPGDVITSMSGTTIEINNTDAEGRLVLCDALHYARTNYNPSIMIDLATLTGACVVALGHEASGVMGNDERLVERLEQAAARSGERIWKLPLWDDYGEAMKSDIADLKNSGGRDGGSITAGWFLKQFVDKTRWAHLDIAGTAWADKARPYTPKGATGVGVRLLIEYLGRSATGDLASGKDPS
jgi:leucyl aminopeptidase